MREVKDPLFRADSLELIPPVEEIGLMRTPGGCRVGEKGADVLAVDGVVGPLSLSEGPDGGEEVDVHGGSVAHPPRPDLCGPADDTGNPLAALPGCPLSLTQGAGAPGTIAVAEPWPVVAGKENEGVLVNIALLESGENLAHRPVDFP